MTPESLTAALQRAAAAAGRPWRIDEAPPTDFVVVQSVHPNSPRTVPVFGPAPASCVLAFFRGVEVGAHQLEEVA